MRFLIMHVGNKKLNKLLIRTCEEKKVDGKHFFRTLYLITQFKTCRLEFRIYLLSARRYLYLREFKIADNY